MITGRDRYVGWINSLKNVGVNQPAAWLLMASRPFHALLSQLLIFSSPLVTNGRHTPMTELIALFEDQDSMVEFTQALLDEDSR